MTAGGRIFATLESHKTFLEICRKNEMLSRKTTSRSGITSMSPTPLVIGHRGAAGSPENSLDAIRAAAAAGADGVEVDVRSTLDGVLVLAHDPVVGGLEVAASTLGSLRKVHPPLATLEEALGACEELPFVNLELKPPIADVDEVLSRLDGVLAKRREGILISSFWVPILARAAERLPRVDVGVLSAAAYDPDGRLGLASAGEIGARTLLPEHPAVTEALIGEAHRLGMSLITWTVDDPVRVRTLAAWGVDGIICDDPASALESLGRPSV